jgi:hypothetical protein
LKVKEDLPETRETMEHVRIWLEKNGLGEFVKKFNYEGYDDIKALFEMKDSEVDELIDEMKMDPKTGTKYRSMIKLLQEQNGGVETDV